MGFYDRLGLRVKVLLAVGLACSICALAAISVAIHFNEKDFRQGLVEKSQTIHSRLDVSAKYVAQQGGLKPVIERMVAKYKSSDEMTEADKLVVLKQVPIFAAMTIGEEDSAKELYEFRVFFR